MSKKPTKPNPSKTSSPPVPETEESTFHMVREIIEILAVALVLAFLFKTFEAEAFVIPTGSMAPTLMGAHKDVNCLQCGFRFKISASEEIDAGNDGVTSYRRAQKRKNPAAQDEPKVVGGTCPQCRFTGYFGKEYDNEGPRSKNNSFRYEGDRILVYKYFYDIMTPQRWNVTVFRFPGGPRENYIKRLVGLENETLRIQNGNIFVRPEGQEDFKISRKPAKHLLSMLQVVNDNDFVNPELHVEPVSWPMSWADETDTLGHTIAAPASWQPAWFPSDDLRSFQTDGSSQEMRWLNYRHIVPSSDDWFYLAQRRRPPEGVMNNPQLITDFSAYNTGIVKDPPRRANLSDDYVNRVSIDEEKTGDSWQKRYSCTADPDSVGFNWTPDLAVECELDVRKSQGIFAMRLVHGGVPFVCEINLTDGKATLSIVGQEEFFVPVQTQTGITAPGKYKLRFCNIDEQLRLWVDENEQPFEGNGEYDYLFEQDMTGLRRDRTPTELDLTPVSFGSSGAQVQVNHLRVFRDIYYIASSPMTSDITCDLLENRFYPGLSPDAERKNANFLSNPELVNIWNAFGKTRSVEFTLEEGQFFLMGDNSAKSMDARTWRSLPGGGQFVSRDYLIGRAAIVYWPHGWPIPLINRAWFPNPKDMRFIE